ncbi:MAG: NAD-dependent epimerase/dehydratase family protein [Ignavibacteriaceae bacterium]
MMHDKVAIVGGRGYLGQVLYDHLGGQGIHCWIVGRQSAVEASLTTSAEYRSSSPSLEKSISGATTVVHLATVTTPAIGAVDPNLDVENIRFTLSLLKACAKEEVAHLIYASSGGTVYGEASAPVDEQQPTNPMCSYAIAKVACENYLRVFASTSSTMVTILRVSNPYGGHQIKKGGQGVISYLATQIAKDQDVVLFGNTVRDYIFIGDVVSAFSLAMARPGKFEIYNISTGVGSCLVDLAQSVARILNKNARLTVGELRPYDLNYNVLRNEKARSMLGWEPKYRLEDGLKVYLREFHFE